MSTSTSDITRFARVRNAALELFADRGVAATSIRDIAAAAGVSPGLVQRHFGTKAGLRDAINDHVVALATAAFAELPSEGDPTEIQQRMGDLVTAFVSENPTVLRYVARAVADRDPGGLGIFEAFVTISRTQWRRLAQNDLLRPDADIEWAALHVVVLNLATVLMSEAIERHLEASFADPEQLERWNRATNSLFQEGLYRRR